MDRYLNRLELISYLLEETDDSKGNYACFKNLLALIDEVVKGKIPQDLWKGWVDSFNSYE